MSTTQEYIEFVYDQVKGITEEIRYKKMFGEYFVYFNEKPLLLVCDNTAYVKMIDPIAQLMKDAPTGFPYNGAKLHYILDIENRELTTSVIRELEKARK